MMLSQGFACPTVYAAGGLQVGLMIAFLAAPVRITGSYTAWAYPSNGNG